MDQKKKVSMILTGKSLKNVTELGELIGESQRTRIIASALEIAKEIMTQVKINNKMLIFRDDNGNEQELIISIG